MWVAVFLLWLSPLFGGQGDAGQPIRVEASFPDEVGCRALIRELTRYSVKHEVLQPCRPDAR